MRIAAEIDKRLVDLEVTRHKKRQEDRDTKLNHASEAGWALECKRHMVLARIHPEKRTPKDEAAIKRLEEGWKQEVVITQDLEDIGLALKDAERVVNEELELEGQADKMIQLNGNEIPIDFKTCNSAMFSHVNRFESSFEMLDSKFSWIRHYPSQMTCYTGPLYNSEVGVLHFKDKEAAGKRSFDCLLDQGLLARLADSLLTINEMIRKGDIPPAIFLHESCRWCDFEDFCFGGKKQTKDVEKISDEDLEALFILRKKLQPSRKEYEEIDGKIKEQLKGKTVIVGNFLYKTTEFDATAYEYPDEIKEKFKTKKKRSRVTIEDLGEEL